MRLERAIRPDGRERWLTRLPPDLARPYAEIVFRLAPVIERTLGPAVVANRWRPGSTELAEPVTAARDRLRRRLRELGPPGRGATLLRADVLACYANIERAAVAAAMPAGDPNVAPLLRTLARIRGRGAIGLPVGPPASALVANAVLASGDRAIAGAGAPHVRWVDDVLVVADGPRQALRAFDAWRAALHAAGLEVNPAKTALDMDPHELPRWSGSGWGRPGGVR